MTILLVPLDAKLLDADSKNILTLKIENPRQIFWSELVDARMLVEKVLNACIHYFKYKTSMYVVVKKSVSSRQVFWS